MLGILCLIVISYVLFWYATKQHLSFKFITGKKICTDLLIGILAPIAYCCAYEFTVAWLVKNPYHLNAHYTVKHFGQAIAYVFRSVIFEELIFRGVLLYLLWRKLGKRYAILISATAFGIYHWFAWQLFGNLSNMVIVFFTTASVGAILAWAFVRTKSMALPIALHLGVNIANMMIFSKDKAIGAQLLVKTFAQAPVVPPGFISIMVLLVHFLGFQCAMLLLINLYTRTGRRGS